MNTLSTHKKLQTIQRSLTFGMKILLGSIFINGLSATAETWNTTANGANWGTAGNWTLPSAVPNAIDATAIFGNVIPANRTVNIDNNFTVGHITFNDNNSYFVEPNVARTLTFDVSSGNASIDITNAGGLHSLGNTNLTISLLDNLEINSAAPSFTLEGLMTGTANLIKNGTGLAVVYGPTPSTLTGNIIANAGVLQIGITADGNQEFNNIGAVNINGGTVTLASNQELNASADLNLNTGILNLSNNTHVFENLTLAANSSINMGIGVSGTLLTFTGTGTRTAGTLTINGWDGFMGIGGGPDRLVFGTSLSSAFLSNIFWSQQNITGALQLASGEIIPIPEPSSVLGGIGLAALAVAYEIRRRRQKAIIPVTES